MLNYTTEQTHRITQFTDALTRLPDFADVDLLIDENLEKTYINLVSNYRANSEW